MGVFHVFQIVQIVPNRATHPILVRIQFQERNYVIISKSCEFGELTPFKRLDTNRDAPKHNFYVL